MIRVSDKYILIIGTGALATLFAARLSRMGRKVFVLGTWLEALDSMNRYGVRVDGEDAYPVIATTKPEDISCCKNAIILVKTWQTEVVANKLKNLLPNDGLAVCIQNGMGSEKILYKALGSDRVAIGITSLGATILAPGIVRETGQGTIWLEDHPRIFQLARSLETAGFSVTTPPDIRPWVWGKLVVNAAINPLTSILGVANGELIRDPRNQFIMDILIQEAVNVTKAHGVILPFTDPASKAAEIVQKTSENISSMLRDYRRGGETEINEINGVIVRLAEKYRIPVPVNRLLLRLVQDRTQVNIDQLIKMVRLEIEEHKR